MFKLKDYGEKNTPRIVKELTLGGRRCIFKATLDGRHYSHYWYAVMFPQSHSVHKENVSEINSSHQIHKHLSLNKLIKSDFKDSVMQWGLQIEQCTVFIIQAWGKSNAVIKC